VIFLWPHLVLQEMSYSLDLVALVAIGLGIVLWFAGLFTLSLGPFGIALRRAACLLPPALLVLFFLYGENMVGGGISRMLVASLFLMAWGTGLLLLLAKDNQNPLRQILCEPINLMTNLGLGMVVLSWVWMTDDREVNTRILGLSIWVLIVQGLSRWLAHREGASLGRLSYLMMSRIYRRLGWLAAAAYWLLPDVEAVMALVLLPLLLLFALLAVLAAAAPLRTLHLVLVGLYLTSALAFYWQEIPLVATLRLPGLLLLASALLTFVLLFQNNRLALAPSGKEGSSH